MGKKKGGGGGGGGGGAKKGGKKNFKVVGAKSLKAKNKTKPVNTGLKKVSKEVTKQKLQDIDEQLVKLQDKIVEKPVQQKKKHTRKGKNQRARMNKSKLAQETNAAADKMEKMDV